jgi:hypothetical protein
MVTAFWRLKRSQLAVACIAVCFLLCHQAGFATETINDDVIINGVQGAAGTPALTVNAANGSGHSSDPTPGDDAIVATAGNGGSAASSGAYGANGGGTTITAGNAGECLMGYGGKGGQVWIQGGDGGDGADASSHGWGGTIWLQPGSSTANGIYNGCVAIEGGLAVYNPTGRDVSTVGVVSCSGNDGDAIGGLDCKKSRGTWDDPTAVQDGDRIGCVRAGGYDGVHEGGVSYSYSGANIMFNCDGEVTTGSVPAMIELMVTEQNGSGPIRRLCVMNDGQLRLGAADPATARDEYTEALVVETSSGAWMAVSGTWYTTSDRAKKLNIATVDTASAWEMLDEMQPVDFEYRKRELYYETKDGRTLTSDELQAEIKGRWAGDRWMTVEDLATRAFYANLDEGSGEWHRGFIAQDLPEEVSKNSNTSLAVIDIAAQNTAALKEAKRLIEALQAQVAALEAAVGK